MEQKMTSHFQFMAVDLLVGTVSSWFQMFVGYPLDFIKTRMQVQTNGLNAYTQLVSIVQKEGFFALYRGFQTLIYSQQGITSPLLGAMCSGSIYFSSYELARRNFAYYSKLSVSDYIPIYQIYLSGSFAGMMSDIFNIPLEFAKIQSQVKLFFNMIFQTKKQFIRKDAKLEVQKMGPLNFLFTTIRTKGFSSIYRGSRLQLTRDFIGCGSFFTCYDQTLKYFTPENQTRKQVSHLGVLSSGVAAGIGFWGIAYPIDIIKTRIQGDDVCKPKYTNSMVCFKDVYNSGGIRSFYKGFGITVFRSICANITCLSVYENLHHFGYSYLEQ